MSNLKSREQSQQVPFEEGKEKMVEQTFSFDPNDNWVSVSHAGHDMTMTLENWERLVEMADKVIKNESEPKS